MNGTTCSVSVCHPSFPVASSLPRLFSNTQLTASIQTVAGIVSLYNDFVIDSYQQKLGFINPLLYSRVFRMYGGFKDVTSGSNPGCDTEGFKADTGWDPVRPAALGSSFPIDIG